MQRSGAPITILVADDDADDRMLIEDAFSESKLQNPLHFVEDGEQRVPPTLVQLLALGLELVELLEGRLLANARERAGTLEQETAA